MDKENEVYAHGGNSNTFYRVMEPQGPRAKWQEQVTGQILYHSTSEKYSDSEREEAKGGSRDMVGGS